MPQPTARICFFGADPIGLPALNYLRSQALLAGVVSQPDRRQGRGKQLQPNPVSAWAADHSVPLLKPERPGREVELWLQDQGVDGALVMAYGHILKTRLLGVPRLGFLNLHASHLPAYRGASPIETAIACGETATAVTLMQIVRRMDAGPTADVEPVVIDEATTGASLRQAMASACVPLLMRCLPAWLSGTLTFTEQAEAEASYCRKLTKADGVLDFNQPARQLLRRIHGLYPWPGCTVRHGDHLLKVAGPCQTSRLESSAAPGTIVEAGAGGIRIACGAGSCLSIPQWQRPGGKLLPARAFLNGYALSPADRLQSVPMPPLLV